jgi:hypothetical protein
MDRGKKLCQRSKKVGATVCPGRGLCGAMSTCSAGNATPRSQSSIPAATAQSASAAVLQAGTSSSSLNQALKKDMAYADARKALLARYPSGVGRLAGSWPDSEAALLSSPYERSYEHSMNRIWIKAIVLVAALWLTSSAVHAQEGAGPCPPGMGYYGTHGGIPSCGQAGNNQAPTTHWEDRWGAIFTDAKKGILGAVTNMPSEDQARQAAMADCQTKGGTQCKFQQAYKNQCAAMVLGDKVFDVSSAATTDEAIQSGIKRCSVESANCHAYYSACSPAAQVQ